MIDGFFVSSTIEIWCSMLGLDEWLQCYTLPKSGELKFPSGAEPAANHSEGPITLLTIIFDEKRPDERTTRLAKTRRMRRPVVSYSTPRTTGCIGIGANSMPLS